MVAFHFSLDTSHYFHFLLFAPLVPALKVRLGFLAPTVPFSPARSRELDFRVRIRASPYNQPF